MTSVIMIAPLNAANFETGAASAGDVLTADGSGGAVMAAPAGGIVITDLTYAELVTAIGASGLTPGMQYRITDFATVHYIVDSDGTVYADSIITGPNEPLIVTAVDVDKLHTEAKSALYPQDVIYYDWDPANWLADLSFGGDSYEIIAGFKGVITWRHDTLLDNYAPGDWRHCKSRRWKTAVPDYNAGTAYSAGNYCTYTAAVYRALRATTGNAPTNTTYWVEVLSLVEIEYWNAAPNSFNGITSNNSEFADFVLYAPGTGSAVYSRCVRATHWESFHDDQTNWDSAGTLLCNNVVFLSDAFFYTCYSCEIAAEAYYNTIGAFFFSSRIGMYCRRNTIGANFARNTIGANFTSNTIGANFTNNSIGSGFGDNSIGSGFGNNSIGSGFSANNVGSYVTSNIIKAGFYSNTVLNSALASANLVSATHVYAAYHCTLFKRADGAARLSYFNNSDVLTVVAVTA